jgi:putative alpha-1,2-mannosidase
MSAWLLFTAMGFYPVTPGSGQYVIGRPFADKIAINLPSGKHFTVTADNLTDANRYVGSVTLNGKPLTRSYITHDEIERGGELHFVMQATPNTNWATAPAARPYSMTGYAKR